MTYVLSKLVNVAIPAIYVARVNSHYYNYVNRPTDITGLAAISGSAIAENGSDILQIIELLWKIAPIVLSLIIAWFNFNGPHKYAVNKERFEKVLLPLFELFSSIEGPPHPTIALIVSDAAAVIIKANKLLIPDDLVKSQSDFNALIQSQQFDNHDKRYKKAYYKYRGNIFYLHNRTKAKLGYSGGIISSIIYELKISKFCDRCWLTALILSMFIALYFLLMGICGFFKTDLPWIVNFVDRFTGVVLIIFAALIVSLVLGFISLIFGKIRGIRNDSQTPQAKNKKQ
jgi:hypothetical protein